MTTTRRLPVLTRLALLAATGGLIAACGDAKPTQKPSTDKAAPAAKGAAAKAGATTATAAPVAKPAATPKPPPLKLDADKFLQARITERCAIKGGEPAEDALIAAADAYAGRQYQPAPDKVAVKKAAAAAAATKKDAPASGKPKAVVPAVPGALVPHDTKLTGKGRLVPDTAEHKTWLKNYAADTVTAKTWPAWKTQLDKAAEGCRWSPKLGLISAKLIERYTNVFVQITCLQDKHRGADGKVDEVAHARAAIKVFQANDFEARGFSRLGLIMAGFPKVQATLHAIRAKTCPDPRLKLNDKANEGEYIGSFRGAAKGSLKLTAKAGKLTGALTVAPGKGIKKAITIAVSGSIDGKRLHLNGVTGQDWLRLDCSATKKVCDWSGEIGFKKRKGTWSYKRPPEPLVAPGAAAPVPVGTDPKFVQVKKDTFGKAAAPAIDAALPEPAPKLAGPPPGDETPIIPKLVPAPVPVPPASPKPESVK